jgi:hypothetical protein
LTARCTVHARIVAIPHPVKRTRSAAGSHFRPAREEKSCGFPMLAVRVMLRRYKSGRHCGEADMTEIYEFDLCWKNERNRS